VAVEACSLPGGGGAGACKSLARHVCWVLFGVALMPLGVGSTCAGLMGLLLWFASSLRHCQGGNGTWLGCSDAEFCSGCAAATL
jgi:hypothetical protein